MITDDNTQGMSPGISKEHKRLRFVETRSDAASIDLYSNQNGEGRMKKKEHDRDDAINN